MSGEPTEADRNWKCDSCGIATFVKYSSGNCHVCEIERLRSELKTALADVERMKPAYDAARGDIGWWCWQGDEFDHPESLTCPVLMSAEQARELVGEVRRLRAELAECQATLDSVVERNEREVYRDNVRLRKELHKMRGLLKTAVDAMESSRTDRICLSGDWYDKARELTERVTMKSTDEKYACVQQMILDETLTDEERAALRHVLGLVNALADDVARYTGTTVPRVLAAYGRAVELGEKDDIRTAVEEIKRLRDYSQHGEAAFAVAESLGYSPYDSRGPVVWMRREIERLRAVLFQATGKNGFAVVKTCTECNKEFTQFAVQSHMTCYTCRHKAEIERLRAELAKFRRLSPNGPRDERTAFERDTM